ncbi:MAG: GNAT family N-acetyltransferase [Candidatus Sabulitectum sp.]|nr:GNAT family N-acetyltransferase [Candidatus Sabulitectum sp.]
MIELILLNQNSDFSTLNLSAFFPSSPLATNEYIASLKSTGKPFTMITGESNGIPVSAALLTFHSTRIERKVSVNVISIRQEDSLSFWTQLLKYLNSINIHTLQILTFCSEPFPVPEIRNIIKGKERWEYHLQLKNFNMTTLHSKHRNMVRKAEKAQVSFSCCNGVDSLDQHVEMQHLSQLRRNLESDHKETNPFVKALLENDAAELCFAKHNGKVISSACILKTKNGGYLFSAGTSPLGMELGASNYLLYKVMELYKDRGLSLFNLGGVTSNETGLNSFKKRFGGVKIFLPEFNVTINRSVLAVLTKQIRIIKSNPVGWYRTYLLARVEYVVFRVSTETLKEDNSSNNYDFKPLSDNDLINCKNTEFQKVYNKYVAYGSSEGAFGSWINGELAHVSWLITRELEVKDEEKNIGLRGNEREITHCFTSEKFRGRSIYPNMIKYLTNRMPSLDVKSIYMITSIKNIPSQKGILKGGLEKISRIVRYTPLPPLRLGITMIIRGHRAILKRFAFYSCKGTSHG